MTLIRWRPMRDFGAVQDNMAKAFSTFFSPDMSCRRWEDVGDWYPDVDIVEDKDNVVVKVDLPGMEKDDIKVSVQDNILTIKGERKSEKEENEKNYHHVERTHGAFSRSFTLPSTVDGQKIKAIYKNGVLSIELPKAEEVKPKDIPISVS